MKILIAALVSLALLTPTALAADAEVLLGISTDFDKQELTLQVVTAGCTAKADFQLALKDGTLTVLRTKRDECKAMESAVSLTWSLKEIGLEANKPFKLGNALIANPMLARVR